MSTIFNEWGYQMNLGCPPDKPRVIWSDCLGYQWVGDYELLDFSAIAENVWSTEFSCQFEHDPELDIEGQMYLPFGESDNPEVEKPVEEKSCPDCKGTGQYIGLQSTENCRCCNGAGKV